MKKFLIFIIFFLFACNVYAQERSFVAELSNDNIAPGRQVELSLTFGVTDVSPPEMPFMPGITFRYKNKFVDKEKGTTIFKYTVISSKTGTFTIGPLFTVHNADYFRSNKVTLRVEKGVRDRSVFLEENSHQDQMLSEHIFVKMEVPDRSIYVNEKFSIKFQLYSDWLDVEDIKVLEASQQKNFIGTSFKKFNSFFTEIGNVKYFVLEYRKDMFSPFNGNFKLSPFKVQFNVVVPKKEKGKDVAFLNDNISFYEKYLGRKKERHEVLELHPPEINIIDLPLKKPMGFTGAVGDFDVDIKENWSRFKKDKVLIFSTTIKGSGNYDSVSSPVFVSKKGIKLYSDDKYKKGNNIVVEQSIKIVDTALGRIPELRFVYFSTKTKSYHVVKKGPFVLGLDGKEKEIEEDRVVEAAEKVKTPEWISSLKKISNKRFSRNYWSFPKVIVLAFVFIEISFFGLYLYKFRREWILTSNDPKAVFIRVKRISKEIIYKTGTMYRKDKSEAFCDAAFRGLQQYFAELLGLPEGNITESAVVIFLIDTFKFDSLSIAIKDVFLFCYKGKFSDSKLEKADMKKALNEIESLLKTFNDLALEIIKARMTGSRS